MEFDELLEESLEIARNLASNPSRQEKLAQTIMLCQVLEDGFDNINISVENDGSSQGQPESTENVDELEDRLDSLEGLAEELSETLSEIHDSFSEIADQVEDNSSEIAELQNEVQSVFDAHPTAPSVSEDEATDELENVDKREDADDEEDADSEVPDTANEEDEDDILRLDSDDNGDDGAEDEPIGFSQENPPIMTESGLENLNSQELSFLVDYYDVDDEDQSREQLVEKLKSAQLNRDDADEADIEYEDDMVKISEGGETGAE
jgi:hypothetical protein